MGGAWWARETLLWPKPELAFAATGATPWLPYARNALVPTVRVKVGGREIVALIDSGAQYSVIDRALFEELPSAGRSMFDMPLVAYGVGGGAQMGRGTSLSVELPGLNIRGLRAAILGLGPARRCWRSTRLGGMRVWCAGTPLCARLNSRRRR